MDLRSPIAAAYREVNGDHPMTSADDAYVDEWFTSLESVCAGRRDSPDDLRGHILARRMPLPAYLRSDGTEMVPADVWRLADDAGGPGRLGEWFRSHWKDRDEAEAEWRAYLSGQYVCLKQVTPANIRRKGELTSAIGKALAEPRPDAAEWLVGLHRLVDELDGLEPPFAPAYDRLRFGGPSSRETCIDDVRRAYPRRR